MNSSQKSGTDMRAKGGILIIDDDESSRILLRDILKAEGHEVFEAYDGQSGLKAVEENPPDVVLLDIMMPGLDGFEVCRRIKGAAKTEAISVILVTALTDRTDRLKGIEAGANDFLVKPVDTRDVILRVRNAVRMKHLYDQVRENYQKMVEAERIRDELTNIIVHDMKNPLFRVSGYLELLKAEVWSSLTDEQKSYVDEAMRSCNELVAMVKSLLDVHRLEQGDISIVPRVCCVLDLVTSALQSVGPFVKDKALKVVAPSVSFPIECDPDMIQRVLTNIIENAVKYSPPKGVVTIAAECKGKMTRISVSDQGPGIAREHHGRIFRKFGRVEQRRSGEMGYPTGLGLAFCKLAVEAHGGQIGVESEIGKGSTFWFTVPSAPVGK